MASSTGWTRAPRSPASQEEKGCAKQYKMVVVKKDRIEIKKQIKFGTGSAKIIGKESFTILEDVAQVLQGHAVPSRRCASRATRTRWATTRRT